MSITFYDDLHFIGAAEVPDCRVTIDRAFGSTVAINLLWRGRIHFAVDDAPAQELEGPVAYWTWDGPRFVYGNVPGHRWHQLWALAGGPRARRMVEGGLVPRRPHPWRPLPDPEGFLLRFRHLIDLVGRGRADDQAERVQLFEALWREIATEPEPGRDAAALDERIDALAARIATDPLRRLDFAAEARRMGLSYHHLRRRFARRVGRPPQAYVLDCRMRWAAGRLANGAEPVKAVAYATGFGDPRAFARQFRRRVGLAPHELRVRGR